MNIDKYGSSLIKLVSYCYRIEKNQNDSALLCGPTHDVRDRYS